MPDKDKVITALAICTGKCKCFGCWYGRNNPDFRCQDRLKEDALALLREENNKEKLTPFDVLEIISSAYGGKQIFFQQNNGTIYDRYKGDYVTLEEAVYRMARMVGDDGDT